MQWFFFFSKTSNHSKNVHVHFLNGVIGPFWECLSFQHVLVARQNPFVQCTPRINSLLTRLMYCEINDVGSGVNSSFNWTKKWRVSFGSRICSVAHAAAAPCSLLLLQVLCRILNLVSACAPNLVGLECERMRGKGKLGGEGECGI
jgi:hypothetical protein